MSYILDALQKSEKERKKTEIPVMQDIFTPGPQGIIGKNVTRGNCIRNLVMIVFLIVFPGSLLWRNHLPDKRHQIKTLDQELSLDWPENDGSIPADGTPTPSDNSSLGSGRETIERPRPPPAEKTGHGTTPDPRTERIPGLAELPKTVRKDIKQLHFAGHVYSEDPALRMIMVDSKILREKQRIDQNLRLDEITRDGVVILYGSKRLQIDLFSGSRHD